MPIPRPRRRNGLRRRLLLYLCAAALALSGCAGLRSQPRFRGPAAAPPAPPAESPDKEGSGESKEQEKRAKAERRKNARKGGGLPAFRLFARERPQLLRAAEKYLGTPYRFGGDTRRGMDCSGLVWRAAKEAWNLELPRSSREMAELGMPLSRAELEPGDLVFFYTGSRRRISHVGIYEGGGRFIHSSTSKGVEVASMEEGYWRRRLVCARRLRPESLSD